MTAILVVDDRAVNRQFLTTLLGYFQYQIHEASDGQQALEVARQHQPALVIADILMPGMDGFELVQRMRNDPALASIPVIFYSATYRVADARTLAAACGVKYVIGKPSEPKDILAIVAKVLDETPRASANSNVSAGPERSSQDQITNAFLNTVGNLETMSLRLSAVIELSLNLAAERSPTRLLDMFCRATQDIIGARRVVVSISGDTHAASIGFSASGFDEATASLLRAEAARGELLRDAPRGRHTSLRSNPGGDPVALGLPVAHPAVRSFLSAPLHVAGRDLGWVYLADKVGNEEAFSEEDRRLVQTLAALAAVAYDSLYLYQEVSEHAGRLRFEIAERRAAEEATHAREQQLAGLATNLPGVAYQRLLSRDGEIRYPYMSERAFEFFGYDARELMGNPTLLLDVIAPEFRGPLRRAFARSAIELSTMDFEFLFTARDGTRKWARTISTPRRLPDGTTLSDGIVLDITAQRRIALERQELEEQLRQSQKLAAIGTLTGGMAHDFNNLLLVILGSAEMLADHVSGNRSAAGMVDAVADAAQRGADLIRLLLAFARQQPLEPTSFDAGERVQNLMRLMRRMLGERIETVVDVAPDLRPAFADGGQVEAAIANLATNARDAMPNGGRLSIGVRNASLDADYTGVHPEAKAGDYVLIEVSDTGMGMSPEVQARAFEPFFTTKDVDKGTGLGLSMVYGFALQSGGHISLYSEQGVGTTARFYIPRTGKAAPAAIAQVPTSSVPRGSEAILVVDDKEEILKTVAVLLQSLGYRVFAAGAPREALAVLEREPEIELLLTDIVMPGGMSGPDLASEALSRWPELKVLFSSGFPDAARARGALPAGSRLLSKPFRRLELAQKVRDALDACA